MVRSICSAAASTALSVSVLSGWGKGHGGLADFLVQCTEVEIPQWIRDTCVQMKAIPPPPPAKDDGEAGDIAVKDASDGTN